MSPFQNTESSFEKREYKKTEFLRLTPGSHLIRILEEDITPIFTHFVKQKYTLRCLEEDCPICQNNRKIIVENPKDFRDIPGYYPKSKRFVFNVLDRTQAKLCPNCHGEVKQVGNNFPPTCPSCNTYVLNEKVSPLNKVKIASIGVELATGLNSLEKTMKANGLEGGWTTYDILLNVEGSGKNKKPLPIAMPQNNDKVEVPEESLIDPCNAVITLTGSEILDLLRNVALKDIYAARRNGQAEKEEAEIEKAISTESKDIQAKIAQLFD